MNDPIPLFVDGTKAVKLVDNNPRRRFLNIWSGGSDLYYGTRNIKPTNYGQKVPAGEHGLIEKDTDEVWVIRAASTSGLCEYSEENSNG